MEKYRIIICGGRRFNDYERLKQTIEKILASFGLTAENGLTHIRVKHDNSYHYRFLVEL